MPACPHPLDRLPVFRIEHYQNLPYILRHEMHLKAGRTVEVKVSPLNQRNQPILGPFLLIAGCLVSEYARLLIP